MSYYAKSCPRGFSNEVSALRFSSRSARDAYCEEAARLADCNSANRGAWPCTRREAERIAARNRAMSRAHRRNSAETESYGSSEIEDSE